MERISKSKVNLFSSLAKKKYRLREGMFIAEGSKTVLDLLESRYTPLYIAGTAEWYAKTYADIPSDVICYEATLQDIRKMSSLSTAPEVVAVYRLPVDSGDLEIGSVGMVLLLDGIQDPGNLGTIVRTADWFGIKRVFASQDTVDIFNPKSIMATMGSLSRVDVLYRNLKSVIEKHPEMPVYGTLLDGDNLYCSDLSRRGFLLMGNEGNGISQELRKLITNPVTIPPVDKFSHPDSLNVGMATSIALSEFYRNELKAKG